MWSCGDRCGFTIERCAESPTLCSIWLCLRSFRLLSGRTCCVQWVYLSTSLWTPSTESRPEEPTVARHWASCLTTAATPSPPVSLFPVWLGSTESQHIWSPFTPCSVSFVSTVFVVLGTSIAVQLGTNPDWMFFCCFAGMFMFYCAHWQTYVSGTLRFGMWDHSSFLFPYFVCLKITNSATSASWVYSCLNSRFCRSSVLA